MCSPSACDLAWLAGLIDGEGHITLVEKHNDLRSLIRRLTITNGDLRALVRVCEMVGGKIYAARLVQRQKQSFQWYCYGANMDRVLRLVLPYLVIKKREAEIAISFTDLQKDYPRKSGTRRHHELLDKYRHLLKEISLIRRRSSHPKWIPTQFAAKREVPNGTQAS